MGRWDSPRLERIVLGPELSEVQIGEARFLLGLVTCQARGALVGGEAVDGAMRCLAAAHEEVFVAFERRDARVERCDFRLEVIDLGAARVVFEKDASQGGRDEGVIFLWDDGHVGHH